MYLVELKPGKEELYRTGDDLAIAIREGQVDARSRIYHRATAKWISITLHPQYKAIVAEHEPARPARKAWGLLPTPNGTLPVALSSDEPIISNAMRQRWKRPAGLGLAGILLMLGIQLAFSGPRPPWSGPSKTAVMGTELAKAAPKAESIVRDEPAGGVPDDYDDTEMVSLASTTIGWPVNGTPTTDTVAVPLPPAEIMPVLPRAPKTAPKAVLPRAPKLRAKALRSALAPGKSAAAATMKAHSVGALLQRYEAASNQVHARLESGIRVARLQRLFGPARLSPGGGVTDTRRGLAGAANFIRVYRQEQAAVDRAYEDSVGVLAKKHRWSPKDLKQWNSRSTRKETPTLELLSGTLLTGIDSILGVLDTHAGAYKVRGSAIAFEDPAATQAYAALRRSIKEQIESAVAAGGAMSFGPTGLLLQAIGTSTLPRET